MGDRLAALVRTAAFRIGTGFVGTAILPSALSSTGHIDVAARLLLQTECPSWLYPVTMGATTVWERWDSMLPDGTINPGEMTSFNHYALGAVGDWMHRRIGGIEPLEPGYRSVLIAPAPGGDLTWARASLETPHGLIEVSWEAEPDGIRLDATIPDGVSAIVRLPDAPERRIGAGRHSITASSVGP
jgi:alpha-L-rhamnosidase